jgi:hypothetical protein
MTLLGLIIALVIIGVVLWAINSFVPMDPKIKQILNVAVVLVVVLWLLLQFVPPGGILNARIGR